MVEYEKVMEAIAKFIDKEITPKIPSWKGWMFGVGSGIALNRMNEIYSTIKDNEMIKALGIIDGNKINVDVIYDELIKQADKGPINIELGFLGTLKLSRKDVDVLYNYIKS